MFSSFHVEVQLDTVSLNLKKKKSVIHQPIRTAALLRDLNKFKHNYNLLKYTQNEIKKIFRFVAEFRKLLMEQRAFDMIGFLIILLKSKI